MEALGFLETIAGIKEMFHGREVAQDPERDGPERAAGVGLGVGGAAQTYGTIAHMAGEYLGLGSLAEAGALVGGAGGLLASLAVGYEVGSAFDHATNASGGLSFLMYGDQDNQRWHDDGQVPQTVRGLAGIGEANARAKDWRERDDGLAHAGASVNHAVRHLFHPWED